VAVVVVERTTCKIWARIFKVAHDCGQVVNPDGLVHTVEGNIIQALSRTIWEEVKFDPKSVTSIDWVTYPILDMTEIPETIDVVILNRPELPPTGAGEGSTRPVTAAVANAIFDATGVRIRRAPFTPDRVRASMSERGPSGPYQGRPGNGSAFFITARTGSSRTLVADLCRSWLFAPATRKRT
jgi:CO/xanthine dehydrogenase Mo-binding subunit